MIGAYAKTPPWAWPGWRLRLPGGPPGGQYHGFIGPDSLGWRGIPGQPGPAPQPSPWDSVWGGLALAEGQTLSDYVERGPAEMRPRPNASGGINVVSAFQTERSAGYAEAPGNYKGVGALPIVHYCPQGGDGCGDTPLMIVTRGPGATATVTQPPPPAGPGSGYLTPYSAPPVSPAPAPTVSVSPTVAPVDAITSWLSESTIFPGIENMWLAGAAAVALYFALRGHK